MSEDETVRCWLVDREYDDRDLVTLTYATPDGDHAVVQQRSSTLLASRPATAAIDVDPADLAPVTDAADRDRFATEANRMAASHDPDDSV